MKVNNIWAAYFSPTGGTRKIVSVIAKELGEKMQIPVKNLDFTLPEKRNDIHKFTEGDLLVLGTPVYAGRIPNKILPDVDRMFDGHGALAIPVSVFGNRSYDDGLIELKLLLENHGFHVFAAAAAVSRHAFSDKIGSGRPDEKDREQLCDFADKAAEEIMAETDKEKLRLISVKGNIPVGPYYTPLGEDGNPAKFLKAKPVVDTEKCIHCGKCAEVCPIGSIEIGNYTQTKGICIKCQACIKNCPEQARNFEDEQFLSHVRMLEQNYERRAENAFFL